MCNTYIKMPFYLLNCEMMKTLLVVLDGAGDRKNDDLGGMTPLQSAKMPHLKSISSGAAKGMLYPISEGIAPESDAAVFSILGYDVDDYTGRGPLEAYGAGIEVDGRTLALRCNFATIDSQRNIIDRRAGRIESEDAKKLEGYINSIELGIPGVRFAFRATVGHRGVVAFYFDGDSAPSSNVSNADIGYVRKGKISVATEITSTMLPRAEPLDGSAEAARSAEIINLFVDKVIRKLTGCEQNIARRAEGLPEANTLLLRDAGVGLPKVKPLKEKFGQSFAFVAEMPVEIGISKLLGMEPIMLRQIKDRRERYAEMARLVLENESLYDFIYVHIKGPDEPGHDGNALLKKKILEEIDANFFSAVEGIDADLCVTADHATPCSLKGHSADPVPLMIRQKGRKADPELQFDESIGTGGGIGTIKGIELLKILLSS